MPEYAPDPAQRVPSVTSVAAATPTAPTEGAKFAVRAVARFVDLVVHNVVVYLTAAIVGLIIGIAALVFGISTAALVDKLEAITLVDYLIAVLGFLVYHTLCEGLHGASLGKLALGLVVLKDDGTPCTPAAALGRSAAFFIDGLFFGLVAAFKMRESPLHKRYGDKWAGTVVVKRGDLRPEQRRSGSRFVAVFLVAILLDGFLAGTGVLLKLL